VPRSRSDKTGEARRSDCFFRRRSRRSSWASENDFFDCTICAQTFQVLRGLFVPNGSEDARRPVTRESSQDRSATPAGHSQSRWRTQRITNLWIILTEPQRIIREYAVKSRASPSSRPSISAEEESES